MKLRPEVIERELTRAVEVCLSLPHSGANPGSDQDRLALADKIADAAMHHLRRSQELAQLARRVRILVTHTCIAIALTLAALATLAPTSNAQDATFRDRAGRTVGTSRTDANGVTTFHDRAGRVTGTARTDRNGVTTFKDAAGRTTGSIRR